MSAMFTASSNRITESNQVRQRGQRPSSEQGQLDLTQVLANVMANWDDEMEQQMPWAQAPRVEREPVRQQVVQNNRPLSQEEKKKEPETVSAIAESEESVLPGAKAVKIVPEVKEDQRSKSQAASSATPEKGEAAQALAWRAPELPKVDGAAVPPSFAVPNHSAGASGFGNTWSHAAKAQTQAENVVHSE